jgi:hypothetical protein
VVQLLKKVTRDRVRFRFVKPTGAVTGPGGWKPPVSGVPGLDQGKPPTRPE